MDLSAQMQAPSLALEPSPGLLDAVRRRAGRVRRRRRLAGGALVVAAAVTGVGVLPGLLHTGTQTGRLATPDRSYGIRTATSAVVLLERLNGADVVAWFEGDELCAAAIRVKRRRECAPGVSAASPDPFPFVFDATSRALRVDDRQLLAGVVRTDVQQVAVEVAGGPPLRATATREPGFPLPVFSVELPHGATVLRLVAYGPAGEELGTRRP
ncbi:MAG: hypothetical protein JWN17_2159 [Frankiales bacterium]|nr:hypothetical protein [Frankiales bacterium]